MTISPISPSATSASSSSRRSNSHPADRRADRAGLGRPVGVVERGDRGGLGQPVALQHLDAERLLDAAQHLQRQRGAARAQTRRCEVSNRSLSGHREQRHVHGRHAEEDVHPVAGEDLQRLLAGSNLGSSVMQAPPAIAAVHGTGLAEGVEQRQPTEDDVARGHRHQRLDRACGRWCRRLSWRELGALRLAGGAGGVQDHGGVRRPSRSTTPGSRLGAGEQLLELPGRHHDDVGAGRLRGLGRLLGEQREDDGDLRAGVAPGVARSRRP